MQWAPCVAVGNDTVQANLMKVGCLKLQHLVDARAIDLIRSLANLIGCIITTTELCLDQLFTVLIKEIKCSEVGTTGDLDQLCETVPYLRLRQSSQECEVEEGVHGSMICSKTVLVVAVVHGDLDAHGSIDQSDDSSRDADEVCVPSVRSACKSIDVS